jgi:E3 ubiquitin-protein ligase NRDP1
MGTDPDLYVHPERISRELICPICTQVLDNPVQTTDDHLFCEDELLEWMSRSNEPTCPVSNKKLDPDAIRKPSRIILNMLAELERYCPNRGEGCRWQGESEHLGKHMKECTFKRKEDMMEEMRRKDEKIASLRVKVDALTKQVKRERQKNEDLSNELQICTRKLKVYDAFFEEGKGSEEKTGTEMSRDSQSELQKMLRIRGLKSFREEEKSGR